MIMEFKKHKANGPIRTWGGWFLFDRIHRYYGPAVINYDDSWFLHGNRAK